LGDSIRVLVTVRVVERIWITSEPVAPGDADAAEPRERLEGAALRRQRRPGKPMVCKQEMVCKTEPELHIDVS